MIQKLFSISSLSVLLFLNSDSTKALGDVNSETLQCTGACADNVRTAIANHGNKYASVTELSSGNISGRNLGGSNDLENGEKAYVLTTKKDRVFSLLKESKPSDNKGPNSRFGVLFSLGVIHKEYGCWCNGFGIDINNAMQINQVSGVAQDEYDEACKAHHMGFDCITIDSNEMNDDSCDPETAQYSILVKHIGNSEDFAIECADDISQNWCQRRTCMVDLRFIARNWKLQLNGVQPDYDSYGHNFGKFNDAVCTYKPRGGARGNAVKVPVVKACCGDYPFRIWYNKHDDAANKCCSYQEPATSLEYGFSISVGHLYNPRIKTCCPGGLIANSNVCP